MLLLLLFLDNADKSISTVSKHVLYFKYKLTGIFEVRGSLLLETPSTFIHTASFDAFEERDK